MILMSCGQKRHDKMNTTETAIEVKKEAVGTVVLVLAELNPQYTKEQTIELSKAIDPMVDQFDGYYGRKMIFGVENPKLMGDIVFYRDVKSFETASEIEMQSETCQKFFATMLPESDLTKMLIGNPIFISPKSDKRTSTVEVALFKAKEGVNQEQLTQAALAVNPVLESLDGFVSRKLAITPDGQWMDILYWTNIENAKSALPIVMENETCQAFFGMTDESNSAFMHFDIAIDTER